MVEPIHCRDGQWTGNPLYEVGSRAWDEGGDPNPPLPMPVQEPILRVAMAGLWKTVF
jgi:hypothetical protein